MMLTVHYFAKAGCAKRATAGWLPSHAVRVCCHRGLYNGCMVSIEKLKCFIPQQPCRSPANRMLKQPKSCICHELPKPLTWLSHSFGHFRHYSKCCAFANLFRMRVPQHWPGWFQLEKRHQKKVARPVGHQTVAGNLCPQV